MTKSARCTPEGRHYEVVSPEMARSYGGWFDPPEPFCCWGMFLAPTAKAAVARAVRSPEFSEWVREQRGSNEPPFKGLRATPTLCEHGACWGCDRHPDAPGCRACAEAGAKIDAEAGFR